MTEQPEPGMSLAMVDGKPTWIHGQVFVNRAESAYLTTAAGTRLEIRTKLRKRPCWRCRFGLRRPKHWNCTPPPPLRFLR